MAAPIPGSRDLLVEVRVVGINPVGAKIRAGGGPGSPTGDLKILGWDGAGTVGTVGPDVTLLVVGNEIFYASAPSPGNYPVFKNADV
jgi:NADPH:quinone reductase-like Zn-dependent oxidoreductase